MASLSFLLKSDLVTYFSVSVGPCSSIGSIVVLNVLF